MTFFVRIECSLLSFPWPAACYEIIGDVIQIRVRVSWKSFIIPGIPGVSRRIRCRLGARIDISKYVDNSADDGIIDETGDDVSVPTPRPADIRWKSGHVEESFLVQSIPSEMSGQIDTWIMNLPARRHTKTPPPLVTRLFVFRDMFYNLTGKYIIQKFLMRQPVNKLKLGEANPSYIIHE